jgi:hypothetical protein
MRCLACGAEMRLMQVELLTGSIERHTFKCSVSVCPQIARRLMFSRAQMPASSSPILITRPKMAATELQRECSAPGSAWAEAVAKVHGRQAALKERAAASTSNFAPRNASAADFGAPNSPLS